MTGRMLLAAALLAATASRGEAGERPADQEKVPQINVPSTELPFHKELTLEAGRAFRLVLPDRQEVAVWCRPTRSEGVERLLNPEDLTLEYGEKPFRPLGIRRRPLAGGEGFISAIEDDSRVIRTGGCIYHGDEGREYFLFVSRYWVGLREDGVRKGALPVRVHVRLATEEEREDLLQGEELKRYFLPRLRSREAAVRLRAIDKLQAYVNAEYLDGVALRRGLHPQGRAIREAIGGLRADADPEVRARVERALCELGDEAALLRFLRPLPPTELRSAQGGVVVAYWCRNCDREGPVQRILPLLDAQEEGLLLFAVGFFATYEYEPAEKKLLRSLSHPSPRVRLEAASELRANKEAHKVIPSTLGKLMRDGDAEVRGRAVQESWRWTDELADAILARLGDKEPSVREVAASALGYGQSRRAVELLLAATRDTSAGVRAQAAGSLGRIGAERALDRLVELLADGSAEVRGEAALGLGGLNRKRAIPPLRERLKEEKDQRVRQLIEQAIRTIQANAGS